MSTSSSCSSAKRVRYAAPWVAVQPTPNAIDAVNEGRRKLPAGKRAVIVQRESYPMATLAPTGPMTSNGDLASSSNAYNAYKVNPILAANVLTTSYVGTNGSVNVQAVRKWIKPQPFVPVLREQSSSSVSEAGVDYKGSNKRLWLQYDGMSSAAGSSIPSDDSSICAEKFSHWCSVPRTTLRIRH